MTAPQTVHVPILLRPIVDALVEPLRSSSGGVEWIIDCTLGGGGHTAALLEALASDSGLSRHRVLSLDQDAGAIERARERFSPELAEGRLELAHSRFSALPEVVGDRVVAGLMADLGFSSDQIESGERGLSFTREGPLDMRLDPSRGESCRDLLRRIGEKELADLIYELGEERFSRRIASAIVRARGEARLPSTTTELAALIERAVPPQARHGRIHAATRTFQALRIAVNEELEELDALLDRGIACVRPGGRVAILSFHSLEDRRVKQAFKAGVHGFSQITKKPIEADDAEVASNPRARSAKLRIAEREMT